MSAGTGGTVAGTATVIIGIDLTAFQRGLASMQAKMKQVSQQMSQASTSILQVAAPIAAGFGVAVKTMADFEQTMAGVQAVTRATEGDFSALSEKARELGATTSFSATEAAEGMRFLGMAGFDTKEILEGIPAVLNLARAGMLDLGRASDIASDVGTAFGLAANEIGLVADVMAATASSANTSIELMGSTMQFLAPVAAAAGQNIKDSALAVGLLGNAGIKGSAAGTSLAVVLRRLADTKVQETLRGIGEGVEALDPQGNIRPVVDVMRDLAKQTEDLAGAEKLALFTELFDARGAKAAINLARATEESVSKLRMEIENSEGSAARMAEVMRNTTAGAWKEMVSAAQELAITIGFQLKDTIVGFLDNLKGLINSAAAWAKENKGLIVTVAKITAGAIALAIALKGVAAIIGIGGILLGGFGKLISLIGLVTKGVIAAKAGFTIMIATVGGPMTAAIVGLAAVVGILIGKIISLVLEIREAEQSTRDLEAATARANQAIAKGGPTPFAQAEQDIKDRIQAMRELGKTDAEIMADLRQGAKSNLAIVQATWSEGNALTREAYAVRQEEARNNFAIISKIQADGLDAFLRVEEEKTEGTESEGKKRIRIAKEVLDKILGIEKGLRDQLAQVAQDRVEAAEERQIRQTIEADPTGALAELEARLAQERAEAAAATQQAFDAIEAAKNAERELTEEEAKALAERAKEEERQVDRILQLKLAAEDAVLRKQEQDRQKLQREQKKAQKSAIEAIAGERVLSGGTNIAERLAGFVETSEQQEQTELLRESVETQRTIAKNTKQQGGFRG